MLGSFSCDAIFESSATKIPLQSTTSTKSRIEGEKRLKRAQLKSPTVSVLDDKIPDHMPQKKIALSASNKSTSSLEQELMGKRKLLESLLRQELKVSSYG